MSVGRCTDVEALDDYNTSTQLYRPRLPGNSPWSRGKTPADRNEGGAQCPLEGSQISSLYISLLHIPDVTDQSYSENLLIRQVIPQQTETT